MFKKIIDFVKKYKVLFIIGFILLLILIFIFVGYKIFGAILGACLVGIAALRNKIKANKEIIKNIDSKIIDIDQKVKEVKIEKSKKDNVIDSSDPDTILELLNQSNVRKNKKQ